jgi:hypothetical protein
MCFAVADDVTLIFEGLVGGVGSEVCGSNKRSRKTGRKREE